MQYHLYHAGGLWLVHFDPHCSGKKLFPQWSVVVPSVRPGETSGDQTVSHLRGKETLVICACLQRISLLLCAENQQSKNSPQERACGRIQIHCRFTLCSGSIGASSPLPRTTRHSHRLQIRNDT